MFHLVLLLAVCLFPLVIESEASAKSYDGYQLYRIHVDSKRTAKLLQRFEQRSDDTIDVWSTPSKLSPYADILVNPNYTSTLLRRFDRRQISYDLVANDIQTLIDGERTGREKRSTVDSSFQVDDYNSYASIVEWLAKIEEENGQIARVFQLGRSSEGRNLTAIKLGTAGFFKPAVWIDGGVHAREWIAPAAALYLIHKLVSDYRNDSLVRDMLRSYDWYILPVANPDGYEYSRTTDRLWRKTRSQHARSYCLGVDANRNWDFHWGSDGDSQNPCASVYAGPRPFSEPETAAVRDFLRSQPNLRLFISLHSYGQMWLGAWGFSHRKPENHQEQKMAAMSALRAIRDAGGASYTFGTIADLMYPAAGTSIDYMQHQGVPFVFGVELRPEDSYFTQGFLYPSQNIGATARDVMAALKALVPHLEQNQHVIR